MVVTNTQSIGLESWTERKSEQEKVNWALALSPLCFMIAEEMQTATYTPAASRPLLAWTASSHGTHPRTVSCKPIFPMLPLSGIGHSNKKSDKYSCHSTPSTILSSLVLIDFCLPLVLIPFSLWTFLGSLTGCSSFPARTCDLPKSSWIAPHGSIQCYHLQLVWRVCPRKALEACVWAHAPGSTSRRPDKFLRKEMALYILPSTTLTSASALDRSASHHRLSSTLSNTGDAGTKEMPATWWKAEGWAILTYSCTVSLNKLFPPI